MPLRSTPQVLSSRKQRGISTLFAIMSFSIFLATLSVVEVGNFMWEKGRAQRIADMAALNAARTMQQGINTGFVNALAAQNGLGDDETLTLTCMLGPDYSALAEGAPTPAAVAVASEDCSDVNVVQARVQKAVPTLFPFTGAFTGDMTVDVTAQATLTPTVTGTVSSSLLRVSNGLLPIQAALLTGQQIVTADVDLTLLQLATELGLNSADELVGPDADPVTGGALLTAALAASGVDALAVDPALLGGLQDLLSNDAAVNLNDIFQVQGDQGLLSVANISLNTLLRAVSLSVLGAENPLGINLAPDGITLDSADSQLLSSFEITGIDGISVQILEPPKVFIAEKRPYQDVIAFESVDQLAIFIDIEIGGGNGVINALKNALKNTAGVNVESTFHIRLRMGVGEGAAQVSNLVCSLPQTDNQIDVAVSPQVVRVELCPCDNDPGSTNPMDLLSLSVTGSPSGGLLGGLLNQVLNILNVIDPLLDTDDTVLTLQNNGDPEEDPAFTLGQAETFLGTDYPFVKTGQASVADTFDLDHTLSGLGNSDYVIAVKNNGGVAQSIINSSANSVNGFVNSSTAALGPALNQVGGVLDTVLATLGVELVPVVATIDSVNCENAILTQ